MPPPPPGAIFKRSALAVSNVLCAILYCVSGDMQGDSAMLEDMVARCCLRKLYLLGSSMALFPVLSGLRSNCSITDLVLGEPITMHSCNRPVAYKRLGMQCVIIAYDVITGDSLIH